MGSRRRFLKQAGLTTAGTLLVRRDLPAQGRGRVSILVDPGDSVSSQAPARWSVEELRRALAERGVECQYVSRLGEVDRGDLCVVAAGPGPASARTIALAESKEALSLASGALEGRPVLFARARDVRGFVYALLELADVVRLSGDPLGALRALPASHVKPPASFRRGQPVAVELAVAEPVTSVTLRYRAVDQSRAWSETAIARSSTGYAAMIADTDTPFPLQYYFELVAGSPAAAVIHPGFSAQWTGQPYYVVRQDR